MGDHAHMSTQVGMPHTTWAHACSCRTQGWRAAWAAPSERCLGQPTGSHVHACTLATLYARRMQHAKPSPL